MKEFGGTSRSRPIQSASGALARASPWVRRIEIHAKYPALALDAGDDREVQ